MMAAMPELNTSAECAPGFERDNLLLQNLRVGMIEARIHQVDLLARLGLARPAMMSNARSAVSGLEKT